MAVGVGCRSVGVVVDVVVVDVVVDVMVGIVVDVVVDGGNRCGVVAVDVVWSSFGRRSS